MVDAVAVLVVASGEVAVLAVDSPEEVSEDLVAEVASQVVELVEAGNRFSKSYSV